MSAVTPRLRAVRDLIEARLGISFPDEQLEILATRLRSLTVRTGLHSQGDALQALLVAPERWLPVALPDIVIGETWFLRQRPQFEALREVAVPAALRDLPPGAPLVIWSAGCSTGEEPYSLALWLRLHFPELWPERIRIVATDVNPAALAHAQARCYGARSVRHVEEALLRRCFDVRGNEYELAPELAQVVRFQEHNLVSQRLPPGLGDGSAHIIFCRNVLLYFGSRPRDAALALFRRALIRRGILMLGHADFLCAGSDWTAHYHAGCFFHRRTEDVQEPAAMSPTPGRPAAREGHPTPPAVAMSWLQPAAVTRLPGVEARTREASPPPHERSRDGEAPASDPMLEAARDAANRGELARARELLAEHTLSNSISTEGHYLAGLVADQVGELELARKALKAALFLDKNLVMGHLILGLVLEQQRDPHGAARCYRTVRELLRSRPETAALQYGDGFTAGRVREMAELRLAEVNMESAT